jgi:hypothetical protein
MRIRPVTAASKPANQQTNKRNHKRKAHKLSANKGKINAITHHISRLLPKFILQPIPQNRLENIVLDDSDLLLDGLDLRLQLCVLGLHEALHILRLAIILSTRARLGGPRRERGAPSDLPSLLCLGHVLVVVFAVL